MNRRKYALVLFNFIYTNSSNMHFIGLVLTLLLALSAIALPVETTDLAVVEDPIIRPRDPKKHDKHHKHHKHHKNHKDHKHPKHPNSFYIHVHNKCPFQKEVAIYGVTPDFQMVQHSKPTTIHPGHQHTIVAPFHGTGLRLSGHAEWGLNGQWQNQLLFEFGYSEYAGNQGTSYDISMMSGSGIDPDVGMGVYPHNKKCESKTCFPWDCPASQGWTNPDQKNIGSPADTTCYEGKTDFKVVYCP